MRRGLILSRGLSHGLFSGEEVREMNRLVYEAKASYAFVERNFNLVKRYWG